MKTIKQINHNLKKYVIAYDYSSEQGEETGYQDFDLTDECDRKDFLKGLSRVNLPFVSIMGERTKVDLYDIKSLSTFAIENGIDLQLNLEDGSYSDIYLELLEFPKPYSRTPCKELDEFLNHYDYLGSNDSIAKDRLIIKNPILDLQDLLALLAFCNLYNFDMTIYSIYDEDNEEEEENNQITIEFSKKQL